MSSSRGIRGTRGPYYTAALLLLLTVACGIASCIHRGRTTGSVATTGVRQHAKRSNGDTHRDRADVHGGSRTTPTRTGDLPPGQDILPTGEPVWERAARLSADRYPSPYAPGSPSYRPRAVWKCDAECRHNLDAIAHALNGFQRDHGRKPDSLNELVPAYLPSKSILECPYSRAEKDAETYTYLPCGVVSKESFQVLCETHFLAIRRDCVLRRKVW